jgi:hypothetical protein
MVAKTLALCTAIKHLKEVVSCTVRRVWHQQLHNGSVLLDCYNRREVCTRFINQRQYYYL